MTIPGIADFSWSVFLQIFSPIVMAGALWKGTHLYVLRRKQRDAIKHLCNEIIELSDRVDSGMVIIQINRLKTIHAYYEKILFESKTPLGLVRDVIDLRITIQSVLDTWAHYWNHQASATSSFEGLFKSHRESALRLKSSARLVLYSF